MVFKNRLQNPRPKTKQEPKNQESSYAQQLHAPRKNVTKQIQKLVGKHTEDKPNDAAHHALQNIFAPFQNILRWLARLGDGWGWRIGDDHLVVTVRQM